MNIINRIWKFFYEREWASFIGFLTFLLVNAESIAELISGHVEEAGNEFDASTLLVIVATLAIRFNVWSKSSVRVEKAESKLEGIGLTARNTEP